MVAYGSWSWSLIGSFTNHNLTDGGTIRILVRWSLQSGGCLREVVTQGGSTKGLKDSTLDFMQLALLTGFHFVFRRTTKLSEHKKKGKRKPVVSEIPHPMVYHVTWTTIVLVEGMSTAQKI